MQITCSFKLSLGGILHKMQFEEWHDITIHLFKCEWNLVKYTNLVVYLFKKLQNNPIQPLKLLAEKYLVKISNSEKYKNFSIKHLSSDTSNTTKIGCSGSPSSVWTKAHSKECLCLEELLLTLKPREEAFPTCPFPPGPPTAVPSIWGRHRGHVPWHPRAAAGAALLVGVQADSAAWCLPELSRAEKFDSAHNQSSKTPN